MLRSRKTTMSSYTLSSTPTIICQTHQKHSCSLSHNHTPTVSSAMPS